MPETPEPRSVVITVGCLNNPNHVRVRGAGATVKEAMESVQTAMTRGKWAGALAMERTYAFCPDCAADFESNPGRDG